MMASPFGAGDSAQSVVAGFPPSNGQFERDQAKRGDRAVSREKIAAGVKKPARVGQ